MDIKTRQELERQRRALELFRKRGETDMARRVSRVIAEMELQQAADTAKFRIRVDRRERGLG